LVAYREFPESSLLNFAAETLRANWGNAMSTNEIKEFLLWNVGINYGLMLVWFGVFVYAHDWMYRMHTRWFKLSLDTFDVLHYAGLSIYKIGVILLNLVPLVALYLST
jgi:hypothetical protein